MAIFDDLYFLHALCQMFWWTWHCVYQPAAVLLIQASVLNQDFHCKAHLTDYEVISFLCNRSWLLPGWLMIVVKIALPGGGKVGIFIGLYNIVNEHHHLLDNQVAFVLAWVISLLRHICSIFCVPFAATMMDDMWQARTCSFCTKVWSLSSLAEITFNLKGRYIAWVNKIERAQRHLSLTQQLFWLCVSALFTQQSFFKTAIQFEYGRLSITARWLFLRMATLLRAQDLIRSSCFSYLSLYDIHWSGLESRICYALLLVAASLASPAASQQQFLVDEQCHHTMLISAP